MKKLATIIFCAVWFAQPSWAAQDITEITSPGGIKAWLVESHSIPFVALEISFKGGTSLDLPGKRGATFMMAGLLEEGAGDLDATAFRQRKEELATNIGFDSSRDSVSISARFLSENRAESIALLRKAIIEPRFSQTALDRVRPQVLGLIERDQKNVNSIAFAAFSSLAYNSDHPYASDMKGTPESVGQLTREDLQAAYHNSMAKDRVFVSAVGDITPDQLGKIVDQLLGDLPEKGATIPHHVKDTLTGGVTIIDFPSPQSFALFGQIGIPLNDPDFYAALVMNHIFGSGDLSARLNTEVRVKRGLTYGVNTTLSNNDHSELYIGGLASANEKMGKALRIIREQWGLLAEKGVTQEEVTSAKMFLTGAYPLRFDGNEKIASILDGMQRDGFPVDYPKTRNGKVDAVTVEDVNRIAKRILQPKNLRIVVVGRPIGVTATN